jgi:lipid-binding SYLF domain-containing protein
VSRFAEHGFQYAERRYFLFLVCTFYILQISGLIACCPARLFYAVEFSGIYQIARTSGGKLALRGVEPRTLRDLPARKEERSSHRGTQEAFKEALRMRYTKCWIVLVAGLLALGPFSSAKDPSEAKAEQDRLQNAGKVMQEILNVPDDIPQDLIDKARCVVVMPSVLKAAFVVGGSYGRGTMVCRTGKDFTGPWGAPAMYALEGGSVGLQIGGEATDFVFLVMNDRGAGSLLHTKVKLGADASIAAGPKGRSATAETDAYMRAEILSYSRARGAFAGISLEGSTLRPDEDANRKLYGNSTSAAKIITESDVIAPPAAQDLIAALQKSSPQLKR